MKEEDLVRGITQSVESQSVSKQLLCFHDTSEINVHAHESRLQPDSGFGLVGNNKDLGFFIHPSLVMDAESFDLLGLSSIQLWHRDVNKSTKQERRYNTIPIDQKESYKWIKGVNNSKHTLRAASGITHIQDREGDIYEQFATVPDQKNQLLVRMRTNRKTSDDQLTITEVLSRQTVKGTFSINIDGDQRVGRAPREAQIALKFSKITINRPKGSANKSLPETLELYVVQAKETEASTPKGQKPICWHLLTTHTIESFEQAKTMTLWYSARWFIEQLFRLIKRKGFKIEQSQLETGWALRKLTTLVLWSAVRVMQMRMAYQQERSPDINRLFNEEQQACLRSLAPRLEGKTEKLKNQNDNKKLAWATWIIARLGGWKGYASLGPPGMITLKKGLERFEDIYQGWLMARESKDVCTE